MSLKQYQKSQLSALVKYIAKEQGFDYCGISEAEFLENEAPRLERWLKKGMQGEMNYMANHFDKRLDPRLLVPGARSVISLLYNYYPGEDVIQNQAAPKISKYAWGDDYHAVIKDKMRLMMEALIKQFGQITARVFVDSAPVMDKVWAAKSGLGWVGKHSNLINRDMGSFFFIAEIICDLELEADGPIKDYCGTCTRCMDACPTGAIPEPYTVDGSRCISYYTIELKGMITGQNPESFNNWAFGCDICQDVCPWNRFSKPHKEDRFRPDKKLLEMGKEAWYELSKELFDELFSKSALQRTGYTGLQRNLKFIGDINNQPNEG